jgi:hypothetical protein
MRVRRFAGWLEATALTVLLGGVASGCAADDPVGGDTDCTPGKNFACECPDGSDGVKTCADDGTFGACTGCTGGGSSSGGAGGAAASSGTGASATSGGGGEDPGPFSLTDSLKDSQPKGNAVGGSFGPDGWTVTQRTDRIWYALPRLTEGSIEFTVSNITSANLDLADHEIFSLYDSGHGIAEPINYNPEFRDNHYKQLVRIYGQMVPERLGQQKFIMLMCPDGAPGYGQCACAKNFYDGDGWWGGDANWTGAPSKIRVTWGQGKATYSRDGVEVWTNDYSQTGLVFGPEELHFTIGCARHDAISDAGMPIGATFSDVVVDGIQGPVATCN